MTPSIALNFFLSLFAKPPCIHAEYRAFRALMLQDIPQQDAKTGRMKIQYFRSQLAYEGEQLAKQHRDLEPVILRGLKIPHILPVLKPWWINFPLWMLLSLLTPSAWRIRQFQAYFRMTKTTEGKRLLFNRLHAVALPGVDFFSDMSQLLDQIEGFRSTEEFKQASKLQNGLIRAALGLGLRDPAQIIAVMNPLRGQLDEGAVAILVEEGVLTCVEHLQHLPLCKDNEEMWYRNARRIEHTENFRDTVRLLHQADVPREIIMHIFSHLYSLEPEALSLRLKQLEMAGISNLATLYDELRETLWRANASVFESVIGLMDIRNAGDIILFKRLLQSNRPPAPAVVRQLLKLGATAIDLAQCQDILIKTAESNPAPIERIATLSQEPFNMSFEAIGQCALLLSSETNDTFNAYLLTLSRYGFGDSTSILAFQNCYSGMRDGQMESLINLAQSYLPGINAADLAEWILGVRSASVDTLRYLLEHINISTTADLRKVGTVARLCLALLKYMVERQQLNTVSKLFNWYKSKGHDAIDCRGGSSYSESERMLFEDATRRGKFSYLAGNHKCIFDAIAEHVDSRLPSLPYEINGKIGEEYWRKRGAMKAEADARLAPKLPLVLEHTKGILLTAVLIAILDGQANLQLILESFDPLIDDLLRGAGPTSLSITPIEVDAVAYVYNVPSSTIQQHWRNVCNRIADLEGLTLEPTYPMKWKKKVVVAPDMDEPRRRKDLVDKLSALVVASEYAKSILAADEAVLPILFKQLKPSVLKNRAADASGLQYHLGLLLVIAGQDTLIKRWRDELLPNAHTWLDEPQEAHAKFNELKSFIDSTLRDSLSNELTRFLERLSHDSASLLIARLTRNDNPLDPSDVLESLKEFINTAAQRVNAAFTGWLDSAISDFTTLPAGEDELIAVVSKHPPAFFAREAAALCTRNNVDMWTEKRHSHLVIFDPVRRCLVGMAMFYVQTLDDYYNGERCLVVRAINPTEANMALFDAVSVIEEVMRVAIEVATANWLACVAFTDASDYFSNRTDITKALSQSKYARHIKTLGTSELNEYSHRLSRPTLFHCKDMYSQSDAVQSLKVIWERSMQVIAD